MAMRGIDGCARAPRVSLSAPSRRWRTTWLLTVFALLGRLAPLSRAAAGDEIAAEPPRVAPDTQAAEAAASGSRAQLDLHTIELGVPADLVVMSRDEHWAYLAAQGEDTIFVIDLRELRVARQLTFPAAIWALAISTDSRRLFVSATTPRGTPHGPCDSPQVPADAASYLLVVDARSGDLIAQPRLSDVAFELLLAPDGTHLAVITVSGLDLVDLDSASVARRIAAPAGSSLGDGAAYADKGAKIFALGTGVVVFDLRENRAHVLDPPPGYAFFPDDLTALPSGEQVFASLVADAAETLVAIDAASEEIKLVKGAAFGASGGVLFSDLRSRLFLPGSGIVLDAATLKVTGHLPGWDVGLGVAAQLSPDQALLYYRPHGSPVHSTTFYGEPPVLYDLEVVDASSLKKLAYLVLDRRAISCTPSSPLALGRKGRTLVAPNPSLGTVSVIRVGAPGS
ncbi:MAG TPA: hypothetical protein VN835_03360 [Steroidobacteraceae bacterium]|nr:hypothetical protein [Steroidobacteraceae bacterium]